MRHSAGILFYRKTGDQVEVLIVHPSGNYNRNAPWSIPKGMPEKDEDLESAARREVKEEVGVTAPPELKSIGFVDLIKSNKRIHCFVAEAPLDLSPTPTSWEIDASKFVPIDEAKKLLHPAQAELIDRLLKLIQIH